MQETEALIKENDKLNKSNKVLEQNNLHLKQDTLMIRKQLDETNCKLESCLKGKQELELKVHEIS